MGMTKNQNYSYFSQLPMDESDKYMSSQSEKLNSSEIKKYIPLINFYFNQYRKHRIERVCKNPIV